MIILWLMIAFVWTACLFFMIISPNMWVSIVEKENAFWVKKGFIKATTAEKIARFEKGKGLKILVAINMVGFFFLAWLSTL